MTAKASIFKVAFLVSTFLVIALNVQAKPNSQQPDRSVVVGTLTSVDSSGKKFGVQQSGEHLHKLYMNSKSKVYYVGLPVRSEQAPRAGLGVKASCGKDGLIKTITFTPPVGEPSPLGEKRLAMTERELFKEVDKDASDSVSYVEFSKYIFHSPKHGPDSFRKCDKDSDGALAAAEFVEAISKVSWWKLSRKTPGEWFNQADKNRDGRLDAKEFASISTSGNHIENVFKRTDRDKSGSLTQRETAAYVHRVTHGKKSVKEKRK